MKRGEVWWVDFDPSQGTEITKTRPAIIVSNDIANKHLARVIVVPLTSNISRIYPGECKVEVQGKSSKAMTDQIITADKRRLKSAIGSLSAADMNALNQALKLQLDL